MVAVAACAEQRVEPEVPRPPLGTTHVAPPGTMPPDTRPPPLPVTPPIAVQLVVDIDKISPEGRRDHAELASALETLADAFALLPGDADRLHMIRHYVDQLRDSHELSLLHADYVRAALEQATIVLAESAPRDRMDFRAYSNAVVAFRRTVGEIDPDRPLLEQQALVIASLRAAARALYVALGLEPPFVDGEIRRPLA